MSKNSTEDLFDLPATDKESKPAKPAKKAAKKAAAKKAPAKKAAKKAVKKVAAKKTATKAKAEEPAQQKDSSAEPKPVIKRMQPAKATANNDSDVPKPIEAPTLPAAPAQHPQASSDNEPQETQRTGRVPGGGPVQQASHQENRNYGNSEGQRDSRSKKRREKRKRRRDNFPDQGNRSNEQGNQGNQGNRNNDQGNRNNTRDGRNQRNDRNDRQQEDRSPTVLTGSMVDANGIIELTPKGFGFLRVPDGNFEQAKEDIFISPDLIRNHSLRNGQWLHGKYQTSNRGPQLVEISLVNDMAPDAAAKLPHFDELKAINPNKRIAFETTPDRYTTRVVDIVSPVGRGQRGLIVSPPRSGKTTLLLHMAEAIREKYDEQIHLMILLVDERPEEVTEFRRALPGAEIYASSNDEDVRNHTRIAELAIERAKRLVEAGKDVFLLMDSITRLARAYNGAMSGGKGGRGRATGSGGITIGALEVPRRLFAAARNTREAGSLTILATALIQTNSRADEAIFMEFKGTGNMELVLDRKIAESYIYPAVDIFKSGTRREELLLPEHTLHKIHLIRRGLSGHRPHEAMERLLYFVKKFPNNPQMLLEIKG